MIIQAELRRKQSEYEGEACSVDKVIELPAQRFKQFSRALLADYDFIAENKNAIRHDEDARHCLLILDAEGTDGFLIAPQGYNFARYSAFVPNARSLLTPDMGIDRSYLSPAAPWRDESRDEMLRMTLRVDGKPGYFDLANYGLEEFYRYHTENGEGKYIDENIVQRPTGLHLYLYLLERYFIGLPDEECCKGKYDRDKLASFKLEDDVLYMDDEPAYTADSFAALTITGSPTSLYMANFWGHDENLMYYRNHCFPYMSPGWGSTSDYIVLSDGDTWDVAMYSNWSFWSSGGAFTCFDQDEYSVRPGTQMTVNTQAYGISGSRWPTARTWAAMSRQAAATAASAATAACGSTARISR